VLGCRDTGKAAEALSRIRASAASGSVTALPWTLLFAYELLRGVDGLERTDVVEELLPESLVEPFDLAGGRG
jgi:hypothetical protein